MHALICGFILAVMALFMDPDMTGGNSYRAWMEGYEKHLYSQMEANIERAKKEEKTYAAPPAGSDREDDKDTPERIAEDACPSPEADGKQDDGSQEMVVPAEEEPVAPQGEVVHKIETSGAELPEVEDITSQTSQTTAPEETAAGAVAGPVLYSVNGAILPEEIQAYLYNALAARQIQWFFPYAVMIAYQESRFNPAAENRNGLDKGLFQYRVTYWSYGDIFSPYDQINVFVQQMAQRAAAGCTISDMISRHKQSDWGPYDQVYVDQVMQWEPAAVRIR